MRTLRINGVDVVDKGREEAARKAASRKARMDKDLDVMDVDARVDGTKAPSTQLDLEDLVLEQGGHFMANKHCELPKDTVKLTRKVCL